MSDRGEREIVVPPQPRDDRTGRVAVSEIFLAFLAIGATSIGGGLVAYLRRSLVGRKQWVSDAEFVRMLSMCQALPGLNGTNMAILMGDRLRGARGATAAITGICLPGAVIMTLAAFIYARRGDHAIVAVLLGSIAAAAVGIVFSVAADLARKSLSGVADLLFVALTIIAVNLLHLSVLVALLLVGALAIWWRRPRPMTAG
ncbi:MAG TPA: chromate transporter [Acetobacteraceae bacterium]|nr:chromate transporter [Acetobacteraceae bacterium]